MKGRHDKIYEVSCLRRLDGWKSLGIESLADALSTVCFSAWGKSGVKGARGMSEAFIGTDSGTELVGCGRGTVFEFFSAEASGNTVSAAVGLDPSAVCIWPVLDWLGLCLVVSSLFQNSAYVELSSDPIS